MHGVHQYLNSGFTMCFSLVVWKDIPESFDVNLNILPLSFMYDRARLSLELCWSVPDQHLSMPDAVLCALIVQIQ